MSQVQQFYEGKRIFITGGTGFLGKILTEKLLRSCPGIKTIYFLIREKKGKNVQDRVSELFAEPVFDVLRTECPDFSKKVVAVAGDIAQEGLGLSAADYARIVDEVSVIFHLAATVRFNEKLEAAVAINVNSTKCIVDIAKACKNLEVGIYVSTAYSNCPRSSIDEELYSPPLSYEEVNKLVEYMRKKKWSEDEMESYTETVVKGWPNTYSFTKAIAEGVIADYAKEIPFAVYRPSIVLNAYREPVAGWISSPIGLSGMFAVTALGIVHFNHADRSIVFDVVPVDYVCNALITCAWETAITRRRRHEDVPVYNYVSGNENPITWGQLSDKLIAQERHYPSNSAIYYPTIMSTTSKRVYVILELLFHLIPAFMFDTVGRLFGKPPRLYKLQRKIGNAVRGLTYFAIRQWDFKNQRVQNLWKRIGSTDRQIFPFNIQNVDWDEQCMRIVKGSRKYITGDTDENVAEAKRRHVYLYIAHTILRLAFIIFVAWVTWRLYSAVCPMNNAEFLAVYQRHLTIANVTQDVDRVYSTSSKVYSL